MFCIVNSFVVIFYKENYFGDDQKFYDFDVGTPPPTSNKKSSMAEPATATMTSEVGSNGKPEGENTFDPNQYRPLHVSVQLKVEDIQANLVKVGVDVN